MKNSKYTPLLESLLLVIIVFVLHESFIYVKYDSIITDRFRYATPLLYLFFYSCSLIILFILIKMKEKNIDSVGQTFLLVTSIKMGLAYILLHPILQETSELITPEKSNFFLIFAEFLTIETVVTIRMLNKKQ
jgi:hypothetical protein